MGVVDIPGVPAAREDRMLGGCVSRRGDGQTNLVVAIGRARLLVAISGALGWRGLLLVAVALGPSTPMSASRCRACPCLAARTGSNRRIAAAAAERIHQRYSPH